MFKFYGTIKIGDNMINTIDITVQNGINEVFHAIIAYNTKICYINNKAYTLKESFLEEFIRTIRLWKNEYGNNHKIDDEEFTVLIQTDKNEEVFHGKGIFPDNYHYFKELLGDIHD